MSITIIGLALLFFLGHALNWFFTVTKIPDLLILVALGYTLGPAMGFLTQDDFGKVGDVLSTLALIVILYEGGLNLRARDLLTSSLPAMMLSLLGFLITGLLGFIAVYAIALKPWPVALLIALGIGSTSSAIVIPMVRQLSIKDQTKTILGLESAFTDVLTIVLFLVLVDGIASGQVNAKDIFLGIGPNTFLAGFWGSVAALIWAAIKRRFAALIPQAFAGEAWALLTYGTLEAVGFNGAIGVLALGFMLANLNLLPEWMKSFVSRETVTLKDMSLLSEITFLLRTFFFIYLGILIKFSDWNVVLMAMLICAIIFLVRYIIVQLVLKPKEFSRLDAMIATAMGPRGLACAVLATIPLQKEIAGGEWIQNTLFAVIPISIFLTAVFVSLSENGSMRKKLGGVFKKYSEPTENLDQKTKEVTNAEHMANPS